MVKISLRKILFYILILICLICISFVCVQLFSGKSNDNFNMQKNTSGMSILDSYGLTELEKKQTQAAIDTFFDFNILTDNGSGGYSVTNDERHLDFVKNEYNDFKNNLINKFYYNNIKIDWTNNQLQAINDNIEIYYTQIDSSIANIPANMQQYLNDIRAKISEVKIKVPNPSNPVENTILGFTYNSDSKLTFYDMMIEVKNLKSKLLDVNLLEITADENTYIDSYFSKISELQIEQKISKANTLLEKYRDTTVEDAVIIRITLDNDIKAIEEYETPQSELRKFFAVPGGVLSSLKSEKQRFDAHYSAMLAKITNASTFLHNDVKYDITGNYIGPKYDDIKYKDTIQSHLNNLLSIPEKNREKYNDYTKIYGYLLKAQTAVKLTLKDHIDPYKTVLEEMQIMSGGDYYYISSVINMSKIEGIIAYKQKLEKSKNDATAHKSAVQNYAVTALDSVIAAHTRVLTQINQLITAAQNYSNPSLESQLMGCSYFMSGSWNVAKNNIPLDKSLIDNTFSSILAGISGLATEEQKRHTGIYEKMELVYSMRETLLEEIDDYYTELKNFGLWKLDSDTSPILDTDGNFIPNGNGLIARTASSNSNYITLKNKLTSGVFTSYQLSGETLTLIASQLSFVENYARMLSSEITTILNKYSSLSQPALIANKQEYDNILQLLKKETEVSIGRKLTDEQIEILTNSSNNLLQNITDSLLSVQALEDDLELLNNDFEGFYQRYKDILPNNSLNIMQHQSEIARLISQYNSFTAEQKGLFDSQKWQVLSGYDLEIASRNLQKQSIQTSFDNLNSSSGNLIDSLYADMKAFIRKESSAFANEFETLQNLYLQCEQFRSKIVTIDTNKIISQKSILDMLKSTYDSFVNSQKNTLSAEYVLLQNYFQQYDDLMSEISNIKNDFAQLTFISNGAINTQDLYSSSTANLDITNLLNKINACSMEQKELLTYQTENLKKAKSYLDKKPHYDNLYALYNNLISQILPDTKYIALKNDMTTLLNSIKEDELLSALMKGCLDALQIHISNIGNLENGVKDIMDKYLSVGDNYISNAALIRLLYEAVNGSSNILTSEQIKLIKDTTVDGSTTSYFKAINDTKTVLDNINNVINQNNSTYNSIKSQINYNTSFIAKKTNLQNLKSNIKNDIDSIMCKELEISLSGILQEIENYLLQIAKLEKDVSDFIDNCTLVNSADLISCRDLIFGLSNRIKLFTIEQINLLNKDGNNYKTLFDDLYRNMKGELQVLDEKKVEVAEIIDSDNGLISYKDKVQNLLSIFTSYGQSEKNYLQSEIQKCYYIANRIGELESEIATVKSLIQQLPTTQKVTIGHKDAIANAISKYDKLTIEQKNILGETLYIKLYALSNRIRVLSAAPQNSGATADVSDVDLAKDMIVVINEISKENAVFDAYTKQVQEVFGTYLLSKVFDLSISFLGNDLSLSDKIVVKINSSSTKNFIAYVRQDGVVEKVDATYLNGQFIFETDTMGVYVLVSNVKEVSLWLYIGIAAGIAALIAIAISVILMFIPSYKIIKDKDEYKIKITRMGSPIRNYRFYVNGIAINENVFSPSDGLITLCYSYKSLFYYTDTLDEMSGCKKKSKII